MNCNDIYPKLKNHIKSFFQGHNFEELVWTSGPIQDVLPRFRVIRVAPGPKINLWLYASIGAWEVDHDSASGIEFFILTSEESARNVEFLAMTAYYHHNHTLGQGHTFPIGETWTDGSSCEYVLVSLPYVLGSEFEVCEVEGGHIHYFWLLPITEEEKEFKIENGLEALEQRFEEKGIEYWNAHRKSVV